MAKIPIFDQDIKSIMDEAKRYSLKFFHTFCGTAHVFLGLLYHLYLNVNGNEKDPRKEEIFNKLKGSMNAKGITSSVFTEKFLELFPKGDEPSDEESKLDIYPTKDYNDLIEKLTRQSSEFGRTLMIEDLILKLFSEPAYTLYKVFVEIIGQSETDKLYEDIVQHFRSVQSDISKSTDLAQLEEMKILRDLNSYVKEHPQTIIDAEEILNKIYLVMANRTVNNPILTGKAGCGKTALVLAFAQLINEGKVPPMFRNKRIYELNTTALMAGTRYRGDFEEKLTNVLSIISQHKDDVIIFIDEIHVMCNANSGNDGSQSAGNLLKPYISSGEIQLIGATTSKEYRKYIVSDPAFASRFKEVIVEEPNDEKLAHILRGLIPVEEKFYDKKLSDELIPEIVKLSNRYAIDQANPRKAITLLDAACSYAKVFQTENKDVDINSVIESVKLQFNIHISKDKIKETREGLEKVILGQDKAINKVLDQLEIVDMGLTDNNKPLLSLMLAGPSGTGKTETAKQIAKYFFGSEKELVTVNMGEYSQEFDISKITGAAPGYVGYEEETGILAGVRQHPNCVLLLDEIEKAHKTVQKALLKILDEGEITDNKGDSVSFRNCIIIMTTNLGCDKNTGKPSGANLIQTKSSGSKEEVEKAIRGHFLPEFVNRIDEIIYYNMLPESIIKQLIDRYQKNVLHSNVKFTKADYDEIMKVGNISVCGARGIQHATKKQLLKVLRRSKEVA